MFLMGEEPSSLRAKECIVSKHGLVGCWDCGCWNWEKDAVESGMVVGQWHAWALGCFHALTRQFATRLMSSAGEVWVSAFEGELVVNLYGWC
jgi:hypothetical protein